MFDLEKKFREALEQVRTENERRHQELVQVLREILAALISKEVK